MNASSRHLGVGVAGSAAPRPRRLLIVNPNTHDGVTALLLRAARAAAPHGVDVQAVQARFGARYIGGEVAAAVAGHAALDAHAAHAAAHGEPDVVLLGCFGDPGLLALRSVAAVPVIGLAEASMAAAARAGRFAIVTGGQAWAPMLMRLAGALGLEASLAGVHTIERSGAELLADPVAAHGVLAAACHAALARWPDVQLLLLGGAALAGMAAPLARGVPVPVLDNVELALAAAWRALAEPVAAGPSIPFERGPWSGLSPALQRRLQSAAHDADRGQDAAAGMTIASSPPPSQESRP